MRTMYDAITPANVPVVAPQMVAGYVGGNWPSYAEMVSRFPHAVHVSIAVQADEDAQVLDCENGDATPGECPGWAQRQRARGQIPTVYCNTSTWPAVQAAFHAQGVPLPEWWEAQYDGDPTLAPGALAKQYRGDVPPGYDVSSVADHWPGVDAATPTPSSGGFLMQLSDKDQAEMKAQLSRIHSAVLPTGATPLSVTGEVIIRLREVEALCSNITAKLDQIAAAPGQPVDVAALAQSLSADLGPDLSKQLVAALGAAITRGVSA